MSNEQLLSLLLLAHSAAFHLDTANPEEERQKYLTYRAELLRRLEGERAAQLTTTRCTICHSLAPYRHSSMVVAAPALSQEQARAIRPIRTKADYEKALARVEQLMDCLPGTLDGDELDVLATVVEYYEKKHFPIDLPATVTQEEARKAAEEIAMKRHSAASTNHSAVVRDNLAIIFKHLAGSGGGQDGMGDRRPPLPYYQCPNNSAHLLESRPHYSMDWRHLYCKSCPDTKAVFGVTPVAPPRPQGDGCREALGKLIAWLEDDVLAILKGTERMGITWDENDRNALRGEIEKARAVLNGVSPTEREVGK